MKLRPYQQDQLAAISTALADGQNRIVIQSATGTGKTVMLSALPGHLKDWLAEYKPTTAWMLVIAHREELIDQAAAKIQAANPELLVCVEQGDRRGSAYADVIVASIQTLSASKFRRLKALVARTTFRVVVVDECHHAPSTTYRTTLAILGFLPMADASDAENIDAATHDDVVVMQEALAGWDRQAPKDRLLVGVTATPNRSDAVGLGCVFQTIAYTYPMKKAIADGWLVPITAWSIETKTSLEDVHIARGDFNQRELADAVNNDQRNRLGLAAWQEYAPGRPTLGFTVDVAHAHALKELYESAGIRAAAVSGETPKEERRLILRQYTDGQIDVVFNCMLLTEGTDLPRTSCILHYKPTKSVTLLEQMTGRGLRLYDGMIPMGNGGQQAKTDCVVIDLVDVSRKHSLQTTPVLYGLPPSLVMKGKQLGDVENLLDEMIGGMGIDLDELLDGRRLTLEQLGAMARRVDVFHLPDLGDFGARATLLWVKVDETTYRLQYPWADGKETVEIQKNILETYDVVITIQPNKGERRQRTIAAQVMTIEETQHVAEAFVRQERQSVLRLKDKSAPWMRGPASQAQLDTLKKQGVKAIPANITKGQASQMLDIVFARKGRR